MAGAPPAVGQLDGRALGLQPGQRGRGPGAGSAAPRRRARRGSGAVATRASTVTGPARSRWPRTHSAAAWSSSARASAMARRSVGRPGSRRPLRPVRPSAASASNHCCQSATGRQPTKREEQVVQLVGVAGPRADLVEHLGHGRAVERAQLVGRHRESTGPASRGPGRAGPPGCDAPRAGRRRGRCRAARSGCRGPGARARPTRPGGPPPAPPRCRRQVHQALRRRAPRSGSRPPSGGPGRGRGPGPARRRRSPGRRPATARRRPTGRRRPCAAGGSGGAARLCERGTTRARLQFHRQRAWQHRVGQHRLGQDVDDGRARTASWAPGPGGSCAGARGTGPPCRRRPPPAARSRRRRRSACAGPGRGPG